MSWLERTTRSAVVTLSPRRFPWRAFLATLALGAVGGLLFVHWDVPLPWMLGSMTIITIGALLRLPLQAPSSIRPPMTAVIGVMLGSGFAPDLLGQLAGWGVTLIGLLAFSVVSVMICFRYLTHVAGYDPTTAFFSSMPGGLVEMVEIGAEHRADVRVIALTHGARILLIVFTIPFLVQLIDGSGAVSAAAVVRPGLAETSASTFLALIACAVGGVWLGERLRLPARYLLGPLLVSGVLHVTGATTFVPPFELVQAAQLVLGTVLGARFVGTAPALIGRVILVATGMTAIFVATTLLGAMLVSLVAQEDLAELVLAFSPGGLPEMSLLALAMGADVAFVATHHVVRVIAVMLAAGPAFTWMQGRLRMSDTPAE